MSNKNPLDRFFVDWLANTSIMRKVIEPIIDKVLFVFSEVLLELVLLGYSVSLIFVRLTAIIGYLNDNPKVGFMSASWIDFKNHAVLYSIFLLLILIWTLVKLKKIKKDEQKEDAVIKELKDINKKLEAKNGKSSNNPKHRSSL